MTFVMRLEQEAALAGGTVDALLWSAMLVTVIAGIHDRAPMQ